MNNVLHEGLGNVDIIYSLVIDIFGFLCINEEKWDINNHHFDSDPIYDTDKENLV